MPQGHPDTVAERRQPALHQQPSVRAPVAQVPELRHRLRDRQRGRQRSDLLQSGLHRGTARLPEMLDRSSRVAHQPPRVLGVQPLLGHPVLHLHGSVSRSNLNKRIVYQAHHQIAVGTANNAKHKGFGMTISRAC